MTAAGILAFLAGLAVAILGAWGLWPRRPPSLPPESPELRRARFDRLRYRDPPRRDRTPADRANDAIRETE